MSEPGADVPEEPDVSPDAQPVEATPPDRPETGASDDVSVRVEELRAEIAEHNRRYHDEDAPTISDAEFDALVRELRGYEEEFPELIVPDSPTQQVGAAAVRPVRPGAAPLPMMSLDNAFAPDELVAWGERASERRLGADRDDEPGRVRAAS